MPLSRVDQVLWLAGFVGHIALLLILFIKRRVRDLPLFSMFIAVNVLRTLILFTVFRLGNRREYFVAYWSLAILDLLMQSAVVYEIALKVFRPTGTWAADTKRGWIFLISVGSILALLLTWMAKLEFKGWEELVVIKGTFFSTTLMAELFVGMIVLSVTAGLPWQTHVGKLARAFGMYSIVDVLIEAAHTLYGASYKAETDLTLFRVRGFAYLACLMYWGVSLWKAAQVEKRVNVKVDKLLEELGSMFPERPVTRH